MEGYPDRDPKSYFSLDLNGNVYLRQPIDFETDPRKFNITIYAEVKISFYIFFQPKSLRNRTPCRAKPIPTYRKNLLLSAAKLNTT